MTIDYLNIDDARRAMLAQHLRSLRDNASPEAVLIALYGVCPDCRKPLVAGDWWCSDQQGCRSYWGNNEKLRAEVRALCDLSQEKRQ